MKERLPGREHNKVNKLRLGLAAAALTASVVGGIGFDNRAHAQEPIQVPAVTKQCPENKGGSWPWVGVTAIVTASLLLGGVGFGWDRELKRQHTRVVAGHPATDSVKR